MGNYNIAVIPGDGIGPEIMAQALRALEAVGARFGHAFAFSECLMGGAAIDAVGQPFPEATLRVCQGSDAVLLGAVGGPKWEGQPTHLRPEEGLFRIRKGLGLFANLRPARLMPALAAACPLRAETAAAGFDILVVRELTGGIYFGEHKTETAGGSRRATDVMVYDEGEIRRILETAFEAARGRRKKVTSVDKANVLDTSRLWRAVAGEVAAGYPDVAFEHMLVDNAAMQLVRNPAQFDVLVTENMFGDILTDEASALVGSIGLVPSASLGGIAPRKASRSETFEPDASRAALRRGSDGSEATAAGGAPNTPGLFEPIHGSAPDIAGRDAANPAAMVLSAALMLRHSLGLEREAAAVEVAVEGVLAAGARTADLAAPGEKALGCAEMGARITKAIAEQN